MEAYLTGTATEKEIQQLMFLKKNYPQIDIALSRIEMDLAQLSGISTPATGQKIEDDLKELTKSKHTRIVKLKVHTKESESTEEQTAGKSIQFIEIEDTSKYMRVKKTWKWRIIGILILMALLLGLIIYFYLENQQMKEQLENHAFY
nr:hypothetical protein [Pedobacter sp. AK017]